MNVNQRTLEAMKEAIERIDLSDTEETIEEIFTFEGAQLPTKDTGLVVQTNKRSFYITILEQ